MEGLGVSDTEVDPEHPVRVRVHLEAVPDGVTVTGVVSATWRGPCHLCLDPVSGELEAEVQELYSDTPQDEEVYQLDQAEIDLRPLVSDALLLELPLLARCPFGGVGVCARAPELVEEVDEDHPSADTSGSADDRPRGDPRWAALDQLDFD